MQKNQEIEKNIKKENKTYLKFYHYKMASS